MMIQFECFAAALLRVSRYGVAVASCAVAHESWSAVPSLPISCGVSMSVFLQNFCNFPVREKPSKKPYTLTVAVSTQISKPG